MKCQGKNDNLEEIEEDLNKYEAVCETLMTITEVVADIPEVVMGALHASSILTEWEVVAKDMIQEVEDRLENHEDRLENHDLPTADIMMRTDMEVVKDVVETDMRDKKKDMNPRKTVMVTDTQVNEDQREDQELNGMRKSMKNQERDDPHLVQEVVVETPEVVTMLEDVVAEVIMVVGLSIAEAVDMVIEAEIEVDLAEEAVIEEATVVVVEIVMQAEVNVLHEKIAEIGMVQVKEEVKVVQAVVIDTVVIEKMMVVSEDEEEGDHVVLDVVEEAPTVEVVVEVPTGEIIAPLVKTIEVCVLICYNNF